MQKSPHLSIAIETLRQLVSFDTTSRNSNLALIEWVEALVSPLGAKTRRVPSSDGTKSNLIVSFGPVEAPGGIILSGHTDVVPVDGQAWSSDPWQLVEQDGKLYGRGTCDMKGFSACALALAPLMAAAKLKAPIHIALSYDEEIGCLGAPSLVEVIRSDYAPIDAVIIGEPSDMKVVSGQKGLSTHQVTVLGCEAHSSQVQQGVSAIMEAIPLLAALKGLADKARMDAPADGPYTPTGTTLTIGLIDGGTAANILARECTFTFDMRFEDDASLYELEAEIGQMVAKLDQEIKVRAPLGGASLARKSFTPAMKPEVNGKAEALARALTGDNTLRAVAYGTEGGIFQNGGMSTIICGPGSITQAHQQDEFVEISQLASCVTFLERLVKHLSH